MRGSAADPRRKSGAVGPTPAGTGAPVSPNKLHSVKPFQSNSIPSLTIISFIIIHIFNIFIRNLSFNSQSSNLNAVVCW